MIYGDTSFLLPLYKEPDAFHEKAERIALEVREPFPLTLLLELEMHNGLRRALAEDNISLQQHDAAFRQIAEDEADGIFQRHLLDSALHFAKARELSRKFTPKLAARSLDILHIAAALLLKADRLASFDEKQRQLATATGLKLLPTRI